MNIDHVLFVIYRTHYQTSEILVDCIYSTKGMITWAELEEEGLSISLCNGSLGPFENTNELTKYAYQASEKFKLDGVCLCDSEAFNKAVNDVNHVQVLNQKILEFAEVLENPEAKKSLFSSFLDR